MHPERSDPNPEGLDHSLSRRSRALLEVAGGNELAAFAFHCHEKVLVAGR